MHSLDYIRSPWSIETKSFEIIGSLMDFSAMDEPRKKIVKRVIHTTADFEYAKILHFSPDAIEVGLNTLRGGCTIISDTKMIQSGINKKALGALGCEVKCFIDHPDVVALAKEQDITRSMASMIVASKDPKNKIFVLGNAPTALFKLLELREGKDFSPAFIIGVPVGFVGAEESKEALISTKIPQIATKGKKGGSTVAVAIVNALLYMLREQG